MTKICCCLLWRVGRKPLAPRSGRGLPNVETILEVAVPRPTVAMPFTLCHSGAQVVLPQYCFAKAVRLCNLDDDAHHALFAMD